MKASNVEWIHFFDCQNPKPNEHRKGHLPGFLRCYELKKLKFP